MVTIKYPEGATPLDDYSGLIPRWVQNLGDLNRVEAENIAHAQRKYLKKRIDNPAVWFNISDLKAIHKAMFGDVWKWSGDFRKSVTSIGIKPYLIPNQLSEFCHEVASWCNNPVDLTFLEQAARVHHKLVLIHPFENGNGRFSRFISDRYLIAYQCSYPNWPYLQDDGEQRADYIQRLRAADKGDYEPLVQLMRELGARDPSLSELLGIAFYKHCLLPQQRLAMVQALLRTGAEVNEVKNNGHSPLHLAIAKNFQEEALLLIKHGADVTFRDKSGFDPFELAVNRGIFNIAQALCQAGYPYVPGMLGSSKIKREMLDQFEKK